MSAQGQISADCLIPILYVRDFEEAMKYYTEKLLFERLWQWGDPPGFGAVRLGKVQMLLHSFEKVPCDGVASPHAERTFSEIQGLKQKHGIDYDTHASYRFVERPNGN